MVAAAEQMVTARLFVNSHSTKGSCLPPTKLPFSRRGNGVPGRSLVGTKVPLRLLPEVKSRRTVSPSARVVTNFHHLGCRQAEPAAPHPNTMLLLGSAGLTAVPRQQAARLDVASR
jgi:hypothetical protein